MFRAVPGVALALALIFPHMVSAQQVSDAMRAALADVPRATIVPVGARPLEIEFGDPSAALSVMALHVFRGGLLLTPDLAARARVMPGDLRLQVPFTSPEGMQASVGLHPGEIGPVLAVGAPPSRVIVMTITEGAAARMATTLGSAGHVTKTLGTHTFLSRGEDLAIDLSARDPMNPFGGILGQSSRFALTEGRVVYAPATSILAGVLEGEGPSLAEHRALAAMLAALDSAGGDAGELARAVALIDGGSPDVLVADMVDGAEETGVMVVVASDTAAAEALAQVIRRNLEAADSHFADRFDGPVTVTAHPGTPAAVSLRRTQPRDFAMPFYRNAPADQFLRMVYVFEVPALLAP